MIYGNHTSVTESTTVAAYEGFVDDTQSGLQAILTESAQDSFKLRGGILISDVMMEQAIILEGAQMEPILEAFVKNTWTKIKEMFQKLWAKVKSWFAAIKRKFNLIFSSGTTFIKKFKKEIHEKSTKGFEYNGFHWTIDAGASAASAKVDIIKKHLTDTIVFVVNDEQMDSGHQKAFIKSNPNATKESNSKNAKEDLVKALGENTVEKVLTDLEKKFRNDKTQKEDIKEFAGVSKDAMVTFIEGSSAKMREVEKLSEDVDQQFKRVIQAVEKAESSLRSDETDGSNDAIKKRTNRTAFATHKAEVARYALSIITSIYGVHVKAIGAAASDFEKTLKSFLNYKPAKESFGYEEYGTGGNTASSIFESAYSQL